MKKLKALLILIIAFSAIADFSHAQTATNYPEVGKPCPDFILRNIKYFSKESAKLSDFKGKWLILDFWNKSCTACVHSFPEVNRLNKKYSNQIQYMLVGLQDKENKIQIMYAKYRQKMNLQLPCAFDSLLCKKFDIVAGPYIIIVDQQGIVRLITGQLTDNILDQLLEKKSLSKSTNIIIPPRNHQKLPRLNFSKPFLVDGNGNSTDSDFQYRTLISKWHSPIVQFAPFIIDAQLKNGKFQEIGAPIYWLYNLAYLGVQRIGPGDTKMYGEYYSWPICEIKDTVRQEPFKSWYNWYCYSLIMPPERSSKKRFMHIMQEDLQNYFGYEVTLEKREMPVWCLVTTSPDALKKLKSKNGASGINENGNNYGLDIQNVSLEAILAVFFSDFDHNGNVKIFKNDTGYSGAVDLKLDYNRFDFDDLRKSLRYHGLDLIERKKLMNCIVIRDPKPE